MKFSSGGRVESHELRKTELRPPSAGASGSAAIAAALIAPTGPTSTDSAPRSTATLPAGMLSKKRPPLSVELAGLRNQLGSLLEVLSGDQRLLRLNELLDLE